LDRRVWLTSREAADYLGTTLGGLRNRVYRGHLKPHKPFGRLGRSYFKRMDLDRVMENS
jgi:excisionase family DNA binding protein